MIKPALDMSSYVPYHFVPLTKGQLLPFHARIIGVLRPVLTDTIIGWLIFL